MGNFFKDCIDCKDRVLYCHSTCEKYKKARKELEKQNESVKNIVVFSEFEMNKVGAMHIKRKH